MRFEQPTGLMFHHFHGQEHLPSQGSVDCDTFEAILNLVSLNHRILKAEDWLERARVGSLEANDVCVTFDDTLACQYDVALPVLEKHDLTAFWFVYTSILEGGLEVLEIFRYFRTANFENINEFYSRFFAIAETRLERQYHTAESLFGQCDYLAHAAYYSQNDKWFRYLRDNILTFAQYKSIMDTMMKEASFSIDKAKDKLWLKSSQVENLSQSGHVIGLHSHTHPTTMAKLTTTEQRTEYRSNSDSLTTILGRRPETVSHPCNSYSTETLDILRSLGVRIGFRANLLPVANRSQLEYAREDHANLLQYL